MQPLFSVGRIVESPNAESTDPQLREKWGHAPAQQSNGACPGEVWFVGAEKVHHAGHEAAGRACGCSPIDENSKVWGQSRHVQDDAHRVFKFRERIRVADHQLRSGAVREYGARHRHAPFIPLNPIGRRRPGGRALVRPCRFGKSQNGVRILVPEEGVEPSRPEGHGILRPAKWVAGCNQKRSGRTRV